MCFIVHRPIGSTIPRDWLDNAIIHNPDGWGIMASNGNRLQISRGMSKKGFSRALKSFSSQEIFIHFRNATHGTIDMENCHPFTIVHDQFAIMHNGVLGIDTSMDDNRSDTWHYANRILAPMLAQDPTALKNPHFAEAVGKQVGPGNKLVILRADGTHAIVNRAKGSELRGCWLSNIYSINAPWDDCMRYSLSDLGKLDRDELIELCQFDPGMVADTILEECRPLQSFRYDYR